MIEQQVVAVLTATAAVTALVDDRIFPVVIREDTTLPAITYMRLAGEREYTLIGAAGWAVARIGLSCWSRTYSQARSLADAVRQALDAYSGTDGDIQAASVIDGADSYDADIDVFGCSLEVEVRWEET